MTQHTSVRTTLLAALLTCAPCLAQSGPDLEFDNGTKGWQVVLDGVMGGLSTGRIAAGEGGTLRFTGETLALAPPFISSAQEVTDAIEVLRESLRAAARLNP